jgi:DNA-binding GntR family transcriptional regulator
VEQMLHSATHRSRAIEPIRASEDIDRIRKSLSEKSRDLLFFDLATQTGLRTKELLKLKAKDLSGLKAGDPLSITMGKENMVRQIFISEDVARTFHEYLNKANLQPDDYLFRSRKGKKALTISTISHMVRSWCEASNIKDVYGAKSLHKTWEYHIGGRSTGTLNSPDDNSFGDSIEPLDTSTLQKKVYDTLFQAIVSGSILPGSRLIVDDISRRLKVSHMPVRAALSRLETTGFIVSQKKKGTIVRGLSEDELKEITTIRLALETLAARLACSVSTVETLNLLKSLMKKYVSTNNGDEFLRINRQFHYTICRDANMPMLQQLIVWLSDRMSPYCHLYMLTTGDLDAQRKPSIRYHQGMLDGMLKKDPNEVVKWLKLDLNQSFTRILKVLNVDAHVKSPFYMDLVPRNAG